MKEGHEKTAVVLQQGEVLQNGENDDQWTIVDDHDDEIILDWEIVHQSCEEIYLDNSSRDESFIPPLEVKINPYIESSDTVQKLTYRDILLKEANSNRDFGKKINVIKISQKLRKPKVISTSGHTILTGNFFFI